MPANAELRQETRYPILRNGPRALRRSWDAMVYTAVPSASPDPATIRAMSFVASLGPAAGPRTVAVGNEADDVMVDLAGEEAFLSYLASVNPAG